MQKKWRIAFVVPRFAVERSGGAEMLVEALSVRLARKGHEVDVLTTCAQDHTRWQNDLRPGSDNIGGVRVHRFCVDRREDTRAFAQLQERIERRWMLNEREELRWIKGSVHSQALYDWIKSNEHLWDVLIFTPYLFGLTYSGSRIVPHKSLLIPCLHPESYAQLGMFRTMFQGVRGILFNSDAEKKLGMEIFRLDEEKCRVVGMGFDRPQEEGDADRFRKKYRLGDSPILLYVGRKERGKSVDKLVQYFCAFKRNRKSDLKLVLIGSGELSFVNDSGVCDLGYVSQQDKMNAYQSANVLCQPSTNESFSIVLMESWLMKTPVLVNAHCAVTRDHIHQSGGGLCYKDFYEFDESLAFLLENNEVCKKMGEGGGVYTVRHYNWENILKKFEGSLEHLLS